MHPSACVIVNHAHKVDRGRIASRAEPRCLSRQVQGAPEVVRGRQMQQLQPSTCPAWGLRSTSLRVPESPVDCLCALLSFVERTRSMGLDTGAERGGAGLWAAMEARV